MADVKYAVFTRPGFGHGNELSVVSIHENEAQAKAKASRFRGYSYGVVVSGTLQVGQTIYADDIIRQAQRGAKTGSYRL